MCKIRHWALLTNVGHTHIQSLHFYIDSTYNKISTVPFATLNNFSKFIRHVPTISLLWSDKHSTLFMASMTTSYLTRAITPTFMLYNNTVNTTKRTLMSLGPPLWYKPCTYTSITYYITPSSSISSSILALNNTSTITFAFIVLWLRSS